jgi:outer membrane protein assembly factor BamB
MLNRFICSVFCCGLSVIICQTSVTAGDVASTKGAFWPQWRGPQRDDIAPDKGLLAAWPDAGPPLRWTGTGLGTGYSSVAIVKGQIYTTGDRKDGEYLICLDDANGKEVWSKRVGDTWGDDGPRSTPTIDGDSVYTLTPHGDLLRLSTADGAIQWRKSMSKDFGGKMMSGWGYSESPLIDGDRLVCTPGADGAALAALDKNTGSTEWLAKIDNCGGSGYSSVVKSNAGGVEQYVTVLGKTGGAVGVRASDGKLLWRNARVAGRVANIPTPVVNGDYVFYTTGYDDGGSALLKIVRRGNSLEAQEVYVKSANELRNHHGGVVLVGDYLYGGHGQNQGFPFCVNFKTGKEVWPRKRGPGEGSAAVVYADGRLYFRYENEVMALIDDDPNEYKVISTFTIPEGSKPGWAHPVIAGGRLYLRDKDRLLCYDLRQR